MHGSVSASSNRFIPRSQFLPTNQTGQTRFPVSLSPLRARVAMGVGIGWTYTSIVVSCVIFIIWGIPHGTEAAVDGQSCSPSYNNQDYCGTDVTKLECYFGRCSCPTRKFYRNVPLNTYWYEPWGKCVAMAQSGCDLNTYGGGTGYQCQPGNVCRNQYQFTDPTVGICRGSLTKSGLFSMLLVFTLFLLKFN